MRAAALLLLVSLSACAQPATSQTDPCALVGTYALDRASIHQGITASMDENLADLGDRPGREGMAQIQWDAKRSAFASVRAQAAADEIVPETTLELYEDGRFAFLTHRSDMPVMEASGRWDADASCRALVLETETDDDDTKPTVTRIEGDRIIMTDAPMDHAPPVEAHVFDRVR